MVPYISFRMPLRGLRAIDEALEFRIESDPVALQQEVDPFEGFIPFRNSLSHSVPMRSIRKLILAKGLAEFGSFGAASKSNLATNCIALKTRSGSSEK